MRLFERLRRPDPAKAGEPPAVEAGQLLDLATGLLVRHFLELGVSAWRDGRRVEFRQHGVSCELRLDDLTAAEVVLGFRIRLDFRSEPIDTSIGSYGEHHREVVGHLIELLATGVLAPILRLEGADAYGLPVETHRAICVAGDGEARAWRLFAGEPVVFGALPTEVRAVEEPLRADRTLFVAVEPVLAALMAGAEGEAAAGFHWWSASVVRPDVGPASSRVTLDGCDSDEAGAAALAAVTLPGTRLLVCRQFGVMRSIGLPGPELLGALDERAAHSGSVRWVID